MNKILFSCVLICGTANTNAQISRSRYVLKVLTRTTPYVLVSATRAQFQMQIQHQISNAKLNEVTKHFIYSGVNSSAVQNVLVTVSQEKGVYMTIKDSTKIVKSWLLPSNDMKRLNPK